MNFIDETTIHVVGGHGGSGAVAFRREKFVPKGGPSGGDGGDGGTVFLEGNSQLATLLDYRYQTHWKAERGQHGQGSNKTGRSGKDLTLPVPLGTEVRDVESGDLIGEVLKDGERVVVARGGRGGRGNARYATSTHQAPREWEPGKPGEDREIVLVLKLIADIGLLGEPNAGKSTLLSAISAARPKIADYPFTTITPQLGVVGLSGHRSLVVADIPGIIEGAHQGKGLGDRFLRHIERTRALAFLIPADHPDPHENYRMLSSELRSYSEELARRPHLIVISKSDLNPEPESVMPHPPAEAMGVITVSGATGEGVPELKEAFWTLCRETQGDQVEPNDVPLP